MTDLFAILVYGCLSMAIFTAGRAYERHKLPRQVTKPDPLEPIERHDWLVLCEPHIHRFEVGATFGSGVTFNREGSKAMAVLMSEMANRLDYARHQTKKIRELQKDS